LGESATVPRTSVKYQPNATSRLMVIAAALFCSKVMSPLQE
jgi:hypothetical protein